MPPEAVKDRPAYTEKIDCFSFGVIIVQVLTRQFPKPGNRRQEIKVNHPGLPRGVLEVRIAEVDRRQNHISQVDPNHPLLPIALDCLKDEDIERPSAQQLCERVASLKERPEYSESVTAAQQENQQLRQQLQQLQLRSTKEREEKERQLGQIRQRLQQEHRESERQMRQLESSEQERAILNERLHEKDRRLCELEGQLLRLRDKIHLQAAEKVDRRDNIKLIWREGRKAPFADQRWCDTIVDGSRVYFQIGDYQLWTYDISGKGWSQLPNIPYSCSSLAILNDQPTAIGGSPFTNKLMSLTMERKWTENFPPMPTVRCLVIAVCTGTALIVAGGHGENRKELTTVEVLNIENRQWSTAADLPEPAQFYSATVCGDQLYMLGGARHRICTESVYTCSVSALLQTCTQRSLVGTLKRALSLSNSSSGGTGVWSKLANLPVTESTCVTFCGQLLAIGGGDSDGQPTTAVYMYNPSTNSWNVISHMTTARIGPFAAVLPDNQLMVVGGAIDNDTICRRCDSVEIGNLI